MNTFTEYLTESAAPRKNTHLTHLEDVILDDGPAGAPFALKILREFGKVLDGGKVSRSLNVSVKWDGAPALIFGPDPVDGRFFVATKGAFAKTPKLAKTHADIDMMYQSGVKNILHLALDELSMLHPSVVMQGDVLFTSQTIKQQNIDGVDYITFQPNTILYAVPRDGHLVQEIESAEIGIVIHTMYTGKGSSLANYAASAITPSYFSGLKRTTRVLAMDASYDDLSGTVTFTNEESADFTYAIENAASAAKSVPGDVYALILNEPVHTLLQQFLNQQVRQNQAPKPAASVDAFILYLERKKDEEIAARKSSEGKQIQAKKYGEVIASVVRAKRQLVAWFTLHEGIQRAKNIVVRKLGQASRISSFVQTSTGFRVTGPEGFVAVAHTGKAVKLVDRLEFSRLNFVAPKSWA